jgi:undecaprenyl-diphosphatase
MEWWQALVLGVVQGLTEFFPVSSDGHLVLAEEMLGLKIPGISFTVALHLATLASVLIVYRRKIAELTAGVFGRKEQRAQSKSWPYLWRIVVASVPAAIIGFGFKDWFEARFDDPLYAGTMIMVTGSVVWSSRWARGVSRGALDALPGLLAAAVSILAGTIVPFISVLAVEAGIMVLARLTGPREWRSDPGYSGAFLMGLAQAVAILPGVSRSGGTVVSALWHRVEPVAAAEFSFLMSVPAILGAAIVSLPDMPRGSESVGALPLMVGLIAAGVTGILAIRFFVEMLRRQNFHMFAYYCWLVGAIFILTR